MAKRGRKPNKELLDGTIKEVETPETIKEVEDSEVQLNKEEEVELTTVIKEFDGVDAKKLFKAIRNFKIDTFSFKVGDNITGLSEDQFKIVRDKNLIED